MTCPADTDLTIEADRRPPTLLDIDALRAAIRQVDAKLVTIDPLMAFLPSNVDSHRDQDVRRVLARLKDLAEETGAAIVLVRHLRKDDIGPAVHRGGGSIGIIGAARVGLLVAKDPDDAQRRVLAVTKNNLSKEAPSLGFELVDTDAGVARVHWLGTTHHTADDLVTSHKGDGDGSAIDDAMAFLRDLLGDGPVRANVVKYRAHAEGVAERTLQRAKAKLGVEAVKQGFAEGSHWVWVLPAEPTSEGLTLLEAS